jgi:hypothetical protein
MLGRLVCAAKLTCLLPHLLNFVLRPQARERYIVEGAAWRCLHLAGSRCKMGESLGKPLL